MKLFLRYLAIALVAVLVFGAARYLDSRPGQHPVQMQTEPAAVPTRETETPPVQTESAQTETTEPETQPQTEPEPVRVVLTFAGDCTFGCHYEHSNAGYGFLMTVGEDYAYPFRNVKSWMESDDLTIVNLEGVLSDEGYPVGSRYSFRGPESYVNFLTENSIEAVTIANNHVHDYGKVGYASTKAVLEENEIPYVEQNSSTVMTLENGVTVGMYATTYSSIDEKAAIAGIKALKEQGTDIVIFAPHWGTEHAYVPTSEQVELAHAVIDAGADIIYGSHPGVLQPIEDYNGGMICYSLGNFSYGGNIYPTDFDSAMIQQEVLLSAHGEVSFGERTVVPVSISSMETRNNYQPTPYAAGSEEYNRVMRKLEGT